MSGFPYRFEFSEPSLPPTTNAQASMHWRTKHAHSKVWNNIVRFYAMKQGIPKAPLKKAKLTLTRRSSSEPDFDGLVSSFKVIIDSLRHNSILTDDKMQNIGVPSYLWEKAPLKGGGIHVLVEELP